MTTASQRPAGADHGGNGPPSDTPLSEAKSPKRSDGEDELRTLPMEEVRKRLDCTAEGLTAAEATKRLDQYGPNEIVEKHVNALLKLLGYFWGSIPWMIEVAVVLSAVLGHWPDFFIILVLLVANSGIGFWEERQAGQAIARRRPGISGPIRLDR